MGWYHVCTHTDMRQPTTLPFQILILSQQEKKACIVIEYMGND